MSAEQVEVDFDLSNARVAIIGLGLMGGSLALALKDRCRQLVAVDPDPETRSLALERKIVAQVSSEPAELLPGTDLVILAAPVQAIVDMIPRLGDWHPGAPVIMDLGSTKAAICQALENMPARFDGLGGHPMCGKETAGLAHADPDLFTGSIFALAKLARSTPRALAAGQTLVDVLGARALWIDPETHDRWAAATSHMPYLLGVALASATPSDAAPLVGPGFRSTSRLAGSSQQMMLDILRTNRTQVLAALKRTQIELERLATALAAGDVQLLGELCASGAERRRKLLEDQEGKHAV